MFQDVLDGKTIGNPTKIEEASDTSYAEPIEEHVEISKEMYIQMIGTAPDGARTQEEINESKILLKESLESESQTSVLLTEDTGQELISLLTEVRGLLSEMCSFAGGMGVSMAGPGPEDEGPPMPTLRKKRKKIVKRK